MRRCGCSSVGFAERDGTISDLDLDFELGAETLQLALDMLRSRLASATSSKLSVPYS